MDHPPGTLAARAGQAAAWLGSAAVMLAATAAAMDREITTLGGHWTGRDFWNNTWRAVRGLLSGINIYGPAHVSAPGIGHGWPVAPHVPGSLLWQAPFALLPLRAAVITYAFVSIAAIWAGVLVLCRPRQPWAVFTAAAAGGFAIYAGGGPMTLVLGQPTGFALLGLALVVRARRPWLAGLGFMLAATTIQTGLP
ncbi:MAG: glycosyltransferase family 87 protein, partial [Gemmatimonadota bacterium]